MSLLVEIYINNTLNRISNEGLALTNFWEEEVMSFDAPQYSIDRDQGGFVRMNFGSIQLSPGLFSSDWVPPIKCPITIKYTDTTEAAAVTLFTGTGQLERFDRNSVTYDLYGEDYKTELLIEAEDYDTNIVAFPRAFGNVSHVNPIKVADQGGKPTYHKGYITSVTPGSNFSVFDDGVNVDGNVVDNADGTFSLNAVPVGEVTLSGIGTDTTLSEIMDWACDSARLNLTFNSTYERTSQPDLVHWASSQMPLVDFLSDICGFYTHLFYINSSTLYLVDMLKDNGSRTLTGFQYFPSEYDYNVPLSVIRSSWETRTPAEQTISGTSNKGKYVRTDSFETHKLINIISSGTTDSTTASKLVDSGADFVTDLVKIEMTAKNTTDSTETKIIAIDDLNTLSLDSDIFVSGETYEVGFIYPYGNDLNITSYTNVKADIETELTNLISILHKPKMTLRIPLSDSLPVPGEKITLTDDSTVSDTTMILRTRNATYDFSDESVIIIGEGSVS